MDTKGKKIIFGIVMLVILLPMIQMLLPIVKERDLKGSFSVSGDIQFSKAAWFSGEYQQKKSVFIKENIGFRKSLVRLNNQKDFYAFNIANANSVIIGRDNVLYEEPYILAYLGLDYLGRDAIAEKTKKLKSIQDSLNAKNKVFLLVLAPGKGSFMNKNFPDKYQDVKKRPSNYDHYVASLNAYGVNFIDFNAWFISMRDTSKNKLYPKTGIHWSSYGEALAMDSMIKKIEKDLGKDIPNLVFTNQTETSSPNFTDQDIEDGMNLLFDIPDYEMTYPEFHFEENETLFKPNFMLLGDSYFSNVFDLEITNKVFNNGSFWYYNQLIYQMFPYSKKSIYDVDYKQEIESNDVVVIMNTESNLKDLGFGFVEQLHQAYVFPDDFKYQFEIRKIEHNIFSNPEWLALCQEKADGFGISLNEQIRKEAIFMVDNR